MFEEAGQLVGDLRNPKHDTSYVYSPRARGTVITTSTATLTAETPCAVLSVSTLISSEWVAFNPTLRLSQHLLLVAQTVLDPPWDDKDLPLGLRPALLAGLVATPLGDIAEAVQTSRDLADGKTILTPLTSDEIALLPADPHEISSKVTFDYEFAIGLRAAKALYDVQAAAHSGGILNEVHTEREDHMRTYRWMDDHSSVMDVSVTDRGPMQIDIQTDNMERIKLNSDGDFACHAFGMAIKRKVPPCGGQ